MYCCCADYYYYPESIDPRYLEQLNDYYKGYYEELTGSYQPHMYDPRYSYNKNFLNFNCYQFFRLKIVCALFLLLFAISWNRKTQLIVNEFQA